MMTVVRVSMPETDDSYHPLTSPALTWPVQRCGWRRKGTQMILPCRKYPECRDHPCKIKVMVNVSVCLCPHLATWSHTTRLSPYLAPTHTITFGKYSCWVEPGRNRGSTYSLSLKTEKFCEEMAYIFRTVCTNADLRPKPGEKDAFLDRPLFPSLPNTIQLFLSETPPLDHRKTALSPLWEVISSWALGSWRSGYCDH